MNSRENILQSVKERQKTLKKTIITFHALGRIQKRAISHKDIIDALLYGSVCEAQGKDAVYYRTGRLIVVCVGHRLVTAYRRRR